MKKITFDNPKNEISVSDISHNNIVVLLYVDKPYRLCNIGNLFTFKGVFDTLDCVFSVSDNLQSLITRCKHYDMRVFDFSEEYKKWLFKCLRNNEFKF